MDNNVKQTFQDFKFKNSGTVDKNMKFEYKNEPCFYMETEYKWSTVYSKEWFP